MSHIVIAIIDFDNPGRIFSALLKKSAQYFISDRWLRRGFWEESNNSGVLVSLKKPFRPLSAEEAQEDVVHRLGVLYAFPGTFDEFLVKFCKVPMGSAIKQCPNQECSQYFTSSPTEFFKHVQECYRKTELAKRSMRVIDDDHGHCCCSC